MNKKINLELSEGHCHILITALYAHRQQVAVRMYQIKNESEMPGQRNLIDPKTLIERLKKRIELIDKTIEIVEKEIF